MVRFVSREAEVRVIYGGTFDPFHRAHEAICHAILANPLVSELRLIPCAIPALKGGASAPAEDRLAMLEAWRLSQPEWDRIVIDDLEIRRDGVSYTLDTVRMLRRALPATSWVFALGTDAWNSLPQWHGADELSQMLSFWVFKRSGEASAVDHTNLTRCDSFAELIAHPGRFWLDDSVTIAVASSQLRDCSVDLIETETPEAVSAYINEHGLY